MGKQVAQFLLITVLQIVTWKLLAGEEAAAGTELCSECSSFTAETDAGAVGHRDADLTAERVQSSVKVELRGMMCDITNPVWRPTLVL